MTVMHIFHEVLRHIFIIL